MGHDLMPKRRLSPRLRQPSDTTAMMIDVMVALLPALAMGTFMFGFRVLVLTAVSVGACISFEFIYRRLVGEKDSIQDLSACVTGLLLAMSLPAAASYWVPVLGAAFAIVVVKQFYGGLGKNFMNPALGGRMLLASFPMLMTTWPEALDRIPLVGVDAVSAATPMSYLHQGVLPPQSLPQLLLGQQGGCVGEVSAFMLLLGGIYLLARGVIAPRIPLSYLGTVALLTLIFPGQADPLSWMLAQLCSGGLLLGAFFFATDPVTSPVTPRGQLMFGVGCGLLTVLLRYHSSYPEGVGWAILTMNCCVWLLDRMGLPRRFGEKNLAAVQGSLRRLQNHMAGIKFVKPRLARPDGEAEGKMPGEAHLDQIREQAAVLGKLGAVVLAVALMIFGVHRVTDLTTAQTQAREQRELLGQVMPQAAFSSETPYRAAGALSILGGYSEDNQLLGYCVQVQSQGFGGPITMVVGVDLDGTVTGVAVTAHKENRDTGARALTPAALSRYIGRAGTLRPSGENAVDAVSGATATSHAITAGVNRALAIVANLDTEGADVYYEDSETG